MKIRAAVALEGKRTEVREFDLPPLPPEGGLLKIEAAGVCGADWPYFLDYPKAKGPLILGHENVGFVAQVGKAAAERWGIKEGDRVALEEYLPCGHCEYCRSAEFRLCDATDTLLGNGVEWAVLQGGAGIGHTVVIQGPGQQGLACAIAAKEAGASCIVVSGLSRDAHRLALAKEFGAHHAIDAERDDLLDAVGQATGGRMADLVIDCASGGPYTVVSAIQLARKGGRVVLGGQKRQRIPDFDSDLLIKKFLTVKGMRGHSYQSVEMALRIIANGRYPLAKMCTHSFALAEVGEALRTVGGEGRPDAIHCSVDPWR